MGSENIQPTPNAKKSPQRNTTAKMVKEETLPIKTLKMSWHVQNNIPLVVADPGAELWTTGKIKTSPQAVV